MSDPVLGLGPQLGTQKYHLLDSFASVLTRALGC
ncbi:hypothetical protein PENANT_c045G08743, partial [Penicillium antarcticum]